MTTISSDGVNRRYSCHLYTHAWFYQETICEFAGSCSYFECHRRFMFLVNKETEVVLPNNILVRLQ